MKRACLLGSLLAASLSSANTYAHVELTSPQPRAAGETEGDLKQGPCGQSAGMNGRTDRVSVYSPGETITVEFVEYINHDGYYRIALDIDGDDDFPDAPDSPDPASMAPTSDIGEQLDAYILHYFLDDQDGFGEHAYTTTVTLPNVECENCTLQVIQYMFDRQAPYYFQCADIAIRGAANTGAGGSTGAGGTATMGTSTMTTGAGGPAGSTTGGQTSTQTASTTSTSGTNTSTSDGQVTSTTGTTTSAGTGDTTGMGTATTGMMATAGLTDGTSDMGGVGGSGVSPPAAAGEEGCSCRTSKSGSGTEWLASWLLLGFVAARRRTRAHAGRHVC